MKMRKMQTRVTDEWWNSGWASFVADYWPTAFIIAFSCCMVVLGVHLDSVHAQESTVAQKAAWAATLKCRPREFDHIDESGLIWCKSTFVLPKVP